MDQKLCKAVDELVREYGSQSVRNVIDAGGAKLNEEEKELLNSFLSSNSYKLKKPLDDYIFQSRAVKATLFSLIERDMLGKSIREYMRQGFVQDNLMRACADLLDYMGLDFIEVYKYFEDRAKPRLFRHNNKHQNK